MEGNCEGDLVLCIGQSAILVGHEVKVLSSKVNYSQPKVTSRFVNVDDFGISDNFIKKSDYNYRFPNRCSTYFDGFKCGPSLAEYVLGILEESDTQQSLSIIFSADEGLGSGAAAFMTQFISYNLPGLVVLTVGILPHLNQGGLASVNTCLGMEQCLEHASCCLLRCMDETTHLLGSNSSGGGGKQQDSTRSVQASVFDEVGRCMAADILVAIREV